MAEITIASVANPEKLYYTGNFGFLHTPLRPHKKTAKVIMRPIIRGDHASGRLRTTESLESWAPT